MTDEQRDEMLVQMARTLTALCDYVSGIESGNSPTEMGDAEIGLRVAVDDASDDNDEDDEPVVTREGCDALGEFGIITNNGIIFCTTNNPRDIDDVVKALNDWRAK